VPAVASRQMSTVTIAAAYGAGGSVVAPEVAERLGLPLIDRAIPVPLAHELAGPLAEDEHHEPGPIAQALLRAIDLSGLFVGVPVPHHHLGADERVAATEEALRRAADRGGAVVLGRAGVFVLRGRPDTLHVRLDGDEDARTRQAVSHEGLDAATAAAQLRETDRARSAYVRQFYPGERWEDPANYHLWIDSTAIGLDVCVDLIVAAARDLFARAPKVSTTLA
jgi:cytidylate kinase